MIGAGKESPVLVCMVFPYMDHDLAGLLDNERVKLSPSQIKLYMKQLLEGTAYCHQSNVIHRDIKPENVFVNSKGELKLGDFGLSRPIGLPDKRYGNEVRSLATFNCGAHNI